MSAYGGAIVLASGELRFRPQSFSYCGHCDQYFMSCTCHGIPHAHDFNFKCLPRPPDGSTPQMLLRRWCSCVAQSSAMGRFEALKWYRDHASSKLRAMANKRDALNDMVEEYVARLPSDPHLPLLAKAIGIRGAPAEGAPRLAREARSAAFTERRALDEWSVSKVTSGPSRSAAEISEPFAPELATSGVSGVLGFCSGKACRFVGDAAALTLGFAFVFISLLSKGGYVEINYTKVERDLLSLLDLNKDGQDDLLLSLRREREARIRYDDRTRHSRWNCAREVQRDGGPQGVGRPGGGILVTALHNEVGLEDDVRRAHSVAHHRRGIVGKLERPRGRLPRVQGDHVNAARHT